jgi:F5/8 type C domain-containing protein
MKPPGAVVLVLGSIFISCANGSHGADADSTNLLWQNDFLRVSWKSGEPALQLHNRMTERNIQIPIAIVALDTEAGRLNGFQVSAAKPTVMAQPERTLWRFALEDAANASRGSGLRCSVAFEFDQATPWVRKLVRIEATGNNEPFLLRKVVLEELQLQGHHPRQPVGQWQSYPVLADGFFCGVEFPIAHAEVDGETVRLSYQPGTRLEPGQPYDAWPVVFGVSQAGQVRDAFDSYIDTFRQTAAPMHIQYNSWWSAPAPYTEQHMLDLIQTFDDEFANPHGARLDSFCLDMGWSNLMSLWRIDEGRFPQGFANLVTRLQKMDAHLGLWVSPSSMYPGAQDNTWAKANGYEIFQQQGRAAPCACLAGMKYQSAFKESLVDLTRRYHIAHFKFDGYIPKCPEKDHGHEPGALSSEKIALGVIDIFKALRSANPQVWIEATCFGFQPSPWWLAHVATVIGTFGDDAPFGRVPCPVYRESYTTARDFFNLQGTKDVLVPIRAQEVLGIIHQSDEPLQNDAVTSILRGHSFVPLYVNPANMDARRWRFLARLCLWARRNAEILANTKPLYFGHWADETPGFADGATPRDPYGYSHVDHDQGLLLVRNPWVKPVKVGFLLDQSTGFSKTFQGGNSVSLYPEYRQLGRAYKYGDRLEVDLGPYETKVLAFGGYPNAPVRSINPGTLSVADFESEVATSAGTLQVQFDATGDAPNKQVWILAEANRPFDAPDFRIAVNHQRVEPAIIESAAGWRASGRKTPEHWVWAVSNLPPEPARVSLKISVLEDHRLSVWLVGKKSVPDDADPSRPIPPPEERFTDAVEVLAPVALPCPDANRLTDVALATQGATATASSIWSSEHDACFINDGNRTTRWNSAPGDLDGAWVEIDFGTTRRIREIRFREAAGGRISRYQLLCWQGGNWKDLLTASKNPRQIRVRHRIEPMETTKIRLQVLAAIETPTLFEFEVRGSVGPAQADGRTPP